MDLEELTNFIKKKGGNRFPDPDAVVKAIQKAVRSSYRLPKTVNDSVNQVLSVSISSMKALKEQIKSLVQAIADLMELIPNTLTSIKGMVLSIQPESLQKLAIFTVSQIRPPWLNMPTLPGTSINQVILRLKTHASLNLVTDF
jgi:hypothetical protein